MSRVNETLRSIPPATLCIMGLCCGVYVCQALLDPNLQHYTMCPRMVLHLSEYYRFITSALFHGGLMHIGMNMLSTAAISTLLEKRFGTLRHGLTILWAILLTSLVYTVAALLLQVVLGMDQLMYQHSVGFSGVIFHLSVLESSLNPHRSRSVFGFISVPSHLYPWALLVVLQFIMPQISFMGHLSGILTGTLQLYGVFDYIMVSNEYLQEMDGWSALRLLTSSQSFVKTPSVDSGVQLRRDPTALRGAIWLGLCMIWRFVKNVAETIKVCVFGYGRDANANIRLSDSWSGSAGAGEGTSVDDDDWVGLPPPSGNDAESRIV